MLGVCHRRAVLLGSAYIHCNHWVCRWLTLELGGHLADKGFLEMISEFAGYDLVMVFLIGKRRQLDFWGKKGCCGKLSFLHLGGCSTREVCFVWRVAWRGHAPKTLVRPERRHVWCKCVCRVPLLVFCTSLAGGGCPPDTWAPPRGVGAVSGRGCPHEAWVPFNGVGAYSWRGSLRDENLWCPSLQLLKYA